MNLKRILIILILLISFLSEYRCQDREKVNSLLNELQTEKNDSLKIVILNNIIEQYINVNPDTAIFYNTQIKEIADQTNKEHFLTSYYNNYGIAYMNKEDYSNALKYFLEALKINEKYKKKRGILKVNNNIGILYSLLKRDSTAYRYRLKALDIALEIDDKELIAQCYINLTPDYLRASENDKALNALLNSLNLYTELKKENPGVNYDNKFAFLYLNLGSVYTALKNNSRANEYYLKAIDLYTKLNQTDQVGETYWYMAKNASLIGDNKKAIEYYNRVITIGKENKLLRLINAGYFELYVVYNQSKDHEKALDAYINYTLAKDSLFTIESEKTLLELNQKYQTEKKEQQIALQEASIKNSRYAIYIISISFILVLLVAFLIIFRWRFISKRRAVELQQKLLRSQMNPHFIFNALSSIQGSVLEKNTDEAADYISNFATLIRLILDSSTVNFIPLRNETKILSYYLQLQQLRYNNDFDFSINVSDELNADFVMIPPMLAQPFIENAIEHGIINKCSKGFIDIRFEKDGEFIVFIVDNFCVEKSTISSVSSNTKIEHKPIAVALTKERLYYLNKENVGKINFEFIDFMDNSVTPSVEKTRVSFRIPIGKE